MLREATRHSLPQSLRRAMERQSASVMLEMGAAPAEVATQLARSAEPGDKEAIDALRQAAKSVGRGDASAAADLSKRALELLAIDDAERGSLVADTVEWLNRATRYDEAEELAVVALAEAASPEVEAEIRLRSSDAHPAQHPVASRGAPPSAAVERHQRGHPGTASGVVGLQPCVAGQKRAVAHCSRRSCCRRGSHR